MSTYKSILEYLSYKDNIDDSPAEDLKFVEDLVSLFKKLGYEDIEQSGHEFFWVNPKHLDTGALINKDYTKIEKLFTKYGYDLDDYLLRSSHLDLSM